MDNTDKNIEVKQESKAVIFNFQKFSIHDGPGIRTIVFIKGCPLRCRWCSNPESLTKNPQLVRFEDNCIACEKCIKVCPVSAIKKINDSIIINRSICNNCGICVDSCPSNSLRMWGKEYTVDEVLEEVMRDLPFYRSSGGGVTISGGEPLTEPEFSLELLKKLKQNFISTAIETSGYGKWRDLKNILDYTDVVMFDIKHVDPVKHKQLTGLDNNLIMDNLRKIVAYNKSKVILRVPFIHGYNDDPENIEQIFELAWGHGIKEINFLPYHRLGQTKYDKLEMKYGLRNLKPKSRDFYLEKLQQNVNNYPEIKILLG